DTAWQLQVTDGEAIRGRIGTKAERSERRTEISGAGELVRLARNANIRRQVLARAELVRDDAAHARKLQGRAGTITGKHVVRAALVSRLAVRHRAADRQLVRDLSRLWHHLVDERAGDVRLDRIHGAA